MTQDPSRRITAQHLIFLSKVRRTSVGEAYKFLVRILSENEEITIGEILNRYKIIQEIGENKSESEIKVNWINQQCKKTIEWGENLDCITDYSFLIGAEDAFEHTPFSQGEKVAFCTWDKIAYHLYTWKFLQDQNTGRCCICGKKGKVQIIQIPILEGLPSSQTPDLAEDLLLKEEPISLHEIHEHIGFAVVVEAVVQEVYETRSTGAYYIRFDKRQPHEPPFQGFKVVIRPRYSKEWFSAHLSPKSYEGQKVRVRGVIRNDPEWGIEILINSPRVIEVISPK
jgi:hypothetical protein